MLFDALDVERRRDRGREELSSMEIMTAAVGVVVDMALMVLALIAIGIAATAGWAIIASLAEIAREKIRRKKGKKNGEDL